ncbi:hypothetical protein SH501x_000941 [Pirellulaceae bacterium SH501]
MSSIFLPLIFLPIHLLIPGVEGEGRKMKSQSSCQLSWNTTWNDMVTYCSCGSTNAVAEGDQQADNVYQTKSGWLSKHLAPKGPFASAVTDSFSTQGKVGKPQKRGGSELQR